jgi:HlyD family secretion protein
MKRWQWIVGGLVAIGVIAAGSGMFGPSKGLPEGLIQATGRVEGDQVRVSTPVAGRVAELLKREGDPVRAGEVLVRLADPVLTARRDRANEAVAAAKARLSESQFRVAAARSRVSALETAIALLRKELPLDEDTAAAYVKAAESSLKAASAVEESQLSEVNRLKDLRVKQAVSQAELDSAVRQLVLMGDYVSRCRTEKVKAEAEQRKAKELAPDRVKAREAELASLKDAVAEAEAAATAAAAAEKEAVAAREEAEVRIRDLTIAAPVSGVITARMVNPGEQVDANRPLMEIVDPDRLYVRVFLSGPDMGRIKPGTEARLWTDAFPNEPVAATARSISSIAEFTPKEVATPDERVKLVYSVKLYLDSNPEGRIKPGMPADAALRWKDGVEWQKPRW